MSKFDQFLAGDQEPQKRQRQSPASLGLSSSALGDNISIKIKSSTMSQLKLLKTIEGHRSYAEVINHLLEDYIDHAAPNLKDKLALLQEN